MIYAAFLDMVMSLRSNLITLRPMAAGMFSLSDAITSSAVPRARICAGVISASSPGRLWTVAKGFPFAVREIVTSSVFSIYAAFLWLFLWPFGQRMCSSIPSASEMSFRVAGLFSFPFRTSDVQVRVLPIWRASSVTLTLYRLFLFPVLLNIPLTLQGNNNQTINLCQEENEANG